MRHVITNRSATVLIIDDVPANIHILGEVLAIKGYRVLIAKNGIEGRAIARQERPDIILLDIMMPDEDGFEVCRKLKMSPETGNIPIIFISALDDLDNRLRGLNNGGIDYITKPFYAEEVAARVRNFIKVKNSTSACFAG